MKFSLMEMFRMVGTGRKYGVPVSDRVALFDKAKQLGFDGIEFGLTYNYPEDPLWKSDKELIAAMKDAASKTGVNTLSLCMHVLNDDRYSPSSPDSAHRATARELLEKTMVACSEVGIAVILVPFFGTARLTTPDQIDHLVSELRLHAVTAEALGIRLGLETSLDAADNLKIIERIESNSVGIYFDVANTAGMMGYDLEQEILNTGKKILQVHIKDYPETKVLGSGEVDLLKAVKALHQIGFDKCLVLEMPTSDDTVMRSNLDYIKELTKKVFIEPE